MLSALHALSFVAGTAAFLFVLLSLASGLLYVAEVIEEHAVLAKTIGQRAIYAICVLLVIFHFVDGLPLYLTALGIFCHLVYLQNFSRTWPSISLTSPAFLASCVLVIVSHFASFNYFQERSRSSYNSYNRGGRWNQHSSHGYGREDSFLDVATYFGVCVWLCPFFLFLSLSANDNVLPSTGDMSQPSTPSVVRPPGSPTHGRKQSSMMKNALSSAFGLVPTSLRPSALTALTTPRGGSSSQRSGLIATPTKSSRPPSPTNSYIPPHSATAAPQGWPPGSPSPSLAFGFPGQSSGSTSGQASPRGPYSPPIGGPDGSRRPSQVQQGGLKMPPMPSRRHTTEEGLGLGVRAGLGMSGGVGGISPARSSNEMSRDPSLHMSRGPSEGVGNPNLSRSAGPGGYGGASSQSALAGDGERAGVRVGPAPPGLMKRRAQ